MKDEWCSPLFVDDHWIYGGAARNKRISSAGGMTQICKRIGEAAAIQAYEYATAVAQPKSNAKVVPLGRIKRKAA